MSFLNYLPKRIRLLNGGIKDLFLYSGVHFQYLTKLIEPLDISWIGASFIIGSL